MSTVVASLPAQEQTRASFDEKGTETAPLNATLPLHHKSEKAKTEQRAAGDDAAEYHQSFRTKCIYLASWLILNLALTLSNKSILTKASSTTGLYDMSAKTQPKQVSLPWSLTCLHLSSTAVGCFSIYGAGQLKPVKLLLRDKIVLYLFSVLFTLNIAISNVSLSMVSVPFHQIMRATCPVFTIALQRALGRAYSPATYLSCLVVVCGVAIATYGDYYFSLPGAVLTLLGVVLAAIKTVASNRLMTGALKLSALNLLMRLAPLAAVQAALIAAVSGEAGRARQLYYEGTMTSSLIGLIAINALLSSALNMFSFQANRIAGALTMTIAANLKQCLTILLGAVMFHVQVGLLHGAGMAVALVGAAWYSKVELEHRSA